MYAIVEINGQQFKVVEGQEIFVNRLEAAEGDQVTFDKVLLVAKEGDFQVGTPTVAAKVETTVLEQVKGDKVIVFKKNAAKGIVAKTDTVSNSQKLKLIALHNAGSYYLTLVNNL